MRQQCELLTPTRHLGRERKQVKRTGPLKNELVILKRKKRLIWLAACGTRTLRSGARPRQCRTWWRRWRSSCPGPAPPRPLPRPPPAHLLIAAALYFGLKTIPLPPPLLKITGNLASNANIYARHILVRPNRVEISQKIQIPMLTSS